MLLWLGLALLVLLVGGIAAGPLMSRVEQPRYDVLQSDGPIELRRYAAMIAAEVEVEGEREPAIREGFRLIAAYIFGANQPNTKIAMTAPVQQQANEKIAMPAQVTQQALGVKAWTVRFVMPSAWTVETLPQPQDTRIKLMPLPPKRMLAIRFSGLATDRVIDSRTGELRAYAARRGIKVLGAPVLAFYNPPWTLPFLRRNEIMYDIEGL